MYEYELEPFDIIKNDHYRFHEMKINGRCYFSDFYESIKNDKQSLKNMDYIFALMENFGPDLLLPKEKFRQVENLGRNNLFEFKKNNIRVYVIKKEPDMLVVLGGSKNTQPADYKWLKKALKDFN